MNRDKNVVILGGGVSGLAAAYFLARTGIYNVTVIERSDVIGGLCGSFKHDGFVLDYGAHKIYSTIPGIMDLVLGLMGNRLIKLPKKNSIYFNGSLLDYPLRMTNLAKVLGPIAFFKLGLGFAVISALQLFTRERPKSYEDYMIKSFGRPAYELVFEPLADKVWGKPSELHVQMARARFPTANGLDAILKLLNIKKETADTNAAFFYYPRAGFGDFPQRLKEEIEAAGGNVITGASVKGLGIDGKKITAVTAEIRGQVKTFPCDYLISSIPLAALGQLIFGEADQRFSRAVKALQYRHLALVYLFVEKPILLKDQWIFFPERKFIFSRIFEQKQMNPGLGPKDRTAICCDFTCDEDSWQWRSDDKPLADKCIEGLRLAGFIKSEKITSYLVRRVRDFYPRYDLQYTDKIKAVSAQLKEMENLLVTGRLGMYNYNNADHCLDMGRYIGEKLSEGISVRNIWDGLEERVNEYKIVD